MAQIILDNLKTFTKEFGCTWSSGFRDIMENGRHIISKLGITQKQTDSSSTANLALLMALIKRDEISTATFRYLYGMAGQRIWKFGENDLTALTNPHSTSDTASTYPDLWVDDDNDLYYTSARYLGWFSTAVVGGVTFTGSGLDDATSGGTSTSKQIINYKVEIDGTGTPDTFKWSDDGGATWDAETVEITGSAQTLNNGVTITFNATTGHTSGDYWEFSTGVWDDDFGDFTSDLDSSYNSASIKRPFIVYDDRTFIGNKDYLASIEKDGSNFDTDYKQLPNKYEVACGATNGNLILVGANKYNKGLLLLWNTTDSGWTNKLYLDNDIYAIRPYKNGWIYASGGGIYYTNGYSIELLNYFPFLSFADDLGISFNNFEIVDDKVIFGAGAKPSLNMKSGFYIYNIKQQTFDFIPNHQYDLYTANYGCIHYNITSTGGNQLLTSYNFNDGADKYAFSQINITNPATSNDGTGYYIVRKQKLPSESTVNKVTIKTSFSKDTSNQYSDQSIDMTVGLINAKGYLWQQAQTNSASSNKNEIQVDGTATGYNNASVGDIVLVLSGVNAGKSSFIESIANAGTNTEKWTLEDDLTGNTEDSQNLNLIKVQKIATKTITDAGDIEFYNNSNIDMSDQYYIFIKTEHTNFPLNIEDVQIEFNEKQ